MYQCHRVVWSEGLLLSPHHFQQWDIYNEAQAIERTALLRPFGWGVHTLELDSEALTRGELHLLKFRGLMPDGHAIRVPEFDPPPPITSVANLYDPREPELDVFLAIPSRRPGGRNQSRDGNGDGGGEEARFAISPVTVSDETSGRNEQPIERAVQNLKLIFGKGARFNYDTLRIAKITQTGTGDFKLVEEYVPPVLRVGASPSLMSTVKRLQEKMAASATELANSVGDPREMTPSRFRHALQLLAINQTIPVLAHAIEHGSIHPEDVYRVLSAATGQLMATSDPRQHHPRDVPAYRHEDLGPQFVRLADLMRELLGSGPAEEYRTVRLSPSDEPGQYDGTIEHEGLLAPHAALFLAVAYGDEMGEVEVERQMKRAIVAAKDRIVELSRRQIPGVGRRLTTPPPAIRRRPGTLYFQLLCDGPEWEAIAASRELALQLPPQLRDVGKPELLGIEGKR